MHGAVGEPDGQAVAPEGVEVFAPRYERHGVAAFGEPRAEVAADGARAEHEHPHPSPTASQWTSRKFGDSVEQRIARRGGFYGWVGRGPVVPKSTFGTFCASAGASKYFCGWKPKARA